MSRCVHIDGNADVIIEHGLGEYTLQFVIYWISEYLSPSIYQLTVVNSRSIQIDICHLHRITLCCHVNTTGQKHGAEWHITFRWGVMKTRSVSQYCETGVFLLYFSTNILSHGIQECFYIDIHNWLNGSILL